MGAFINGRWPDSYISTEQRQGMSDLFIKHVHWYLSYNIRSIVATGLDRSDPQDKL